MLILDDGLGSLLEINEYWGFRVGLEVDIDTSARRGVERYVDGVGPAAEVLHNVEGCGVRGAGFVC